MMGILRAVGYTNLVGVPRKLGSLNAKSYLAGQKEKRRSTFIKKKTFSAINPSVSFSYGVSLQIAGNAVKRAADNLVTAAKSAAIFEEQETTVVINQRFVGGIAQELEAQEKILRIEKELAAARNKLSQIRQAKYRPEDDD